MSRHEIERKLNLAQFGALVLRVEADSRLNREAKTQVKNRIVLEHLSQEAKRELKEANLIYNALVSR